MSPLLARIEAAWARSDALFALLSRDALYDQPIPLRQPFLFYLGHLPAFAWNQVCRAKLGLPSFNPDYDALFERGIDPVGVDEYRPAAASQWPSEAQVIAYRARARDALRRAFEAADDAQVFPMVIEHELMHQETLLYMLQELPASRKAERAPEALAEAIARAFAIDPSARKPSTARARVPGGEATLGARRGSIDFGWDNEFPEHRVFVPAFEMDTLPVSNGEYLEFVLAGGYTTRALWTEDAWQWKERRRLQHPIVWARAGRAGKGWEYRLPLKQIPLEQAASLPVYVSFAEARAFCRWRGVRLPTEAEVHRAAYGTPEGAERRHPWGDGAPRPEHGNFNFHRFGPAPVGSSPAGTSAWGIAELVGNGWEWTETVFEPFAGFEVTVPSYPGYSADFFDGAHYVMHGASWATDAALVRRSFRNWFQPHYPYMFAKLRGVSPA